MIPPLVAFASSNTVSKCNFNISCPRLVGEKVEIESMKETGAVWIYGRFSLIFKLRSGFTF